MKKYLFVLILCLTGCGYERPEFTGKDVFVVKCIKLYTDSTCIYGSNVKHPVGQFFALAPEFIAPKDVFNIGDTVKFQPIIK